MALFRVKICGITTIEDAVAVVEAGAEAIGLNFYAKSPRYVTPSQARQIAAAVPTKTTKVGVFVNSSLDEVARLSDEVGLDIVQLHGDEPPEALGLLAPRAILRAFRCRNSGFEPLIHHVDRCREIGHVPVAVLVDAYQPGSYGGTGKVADWHRVPELARQLPGVPIVLAGGLGPENVAEAIRVARPAAVDAASGVESSPGKKDASLVGDFVRNALGAFGLPQRPDR